jgi:hypothetical protein
MTRKSKTTKKTKKSKPNVTSTATKPSATQKSRAPYAASTNMARSITKPGRNLKNNNLGKSVHEQVCAVTDPFCYKARCAKWPDGQGNGTVGYQIRGRQVLVTVAAGDTTSGAIQFTGDLPFSVLKALTISAGTITWAATYSGTPGGLDFLNFASKYRIVSWGVVVRNTLPANTAQGSVILRKLTTQFIPGSTQASASMYGAEVSEYSLYPGAEYTMISKPTGTAARAFSAQNTGSTLVNGGSWDAIQVEAFNAAPNTTVCDIELVYNVEFQLVTSQLSLHEFIPPSAPHVPKIVEASSAVVNKATTIIEGGIKAVGQHVLSHVEDFFSSAGEDLLGLLF